MTPSLPAPLVQLIQACPLPDERETQRLLEGDLEYGARLYLDRASYYGSRGGWWRVWREIQRTRGVSLHEVLRELSSKQTAWFAHWAFQHDEIADALLAYRWYLDHRPEVGPPPADNAVYLDHLLKQGRNTEVLDTVEEFRRDDDDLPREELRAARALFLLGDHAAAMARLASVRERYHDDGNLWALTALLSAALGDKEQARAALAECAKLGVYDRELEQELLHAMGLSRDQWKTRRAPYLPEPLDFRGRQLRWWADPGARLRPTREASCHWYGGDEFRMPACWGCGHPIRQWFALDLREIEPLRQRLPSWTLFPLLGCMDCSVHMGRHDYQADLGTLCIELVNVETSLKRFGEPHQVLPAIPRQFAQLEWERPRLDPTDSDLETFPAGDWDRPQVAGTPAWVQDPLRVYCRTCRGEMVFVAAMATTSDFNPEIWINNGSGFQYHFACDACHTISVIAQWT